MLVVAFGHRKRKGKDTCAKFLATILRTEIKNLNVKRVGFATELKAQCHRLYGWAGLREAEYYEEPSHEKEREITLPKIGKTPRQIWIEYGTTVGRAIYVHTWVDFLFGQPTTDCTLIVDMRFPNEFARVKELGGLVVKINNPRILDSDDVADKPLASVPDSEWHCVINNDGTLQELHTKIQSLYQEMVRPKLLARRAV